MNDLLYHLRNKLVAGVFAAIPIVICIYVAVWVEANTRVMTEPIGFHFPGLGFLLVLLAVYVLGVAVTSVAGRLLLRLVDRVLGKVPGLNLLVRAWKDVLVVSPEKSGMFHQAVLVPLAADRYQLGFTNGRPLPNDAERLCVFLPDLPNPFAGRLVLVPKSTCVPLSVTIEDAIKYQLSSGNYLPPGLTVNPTPRDATS